MDKDYYLTIKKMILTHRLLTGDVKLKVLNKIYKLKKRSLTFTSISTFKLACFKDRNLKKEII